jgi:hypothetical protein
VVSGILVVVIEKTCPGCGTIVRCVPESYLHATGEGLRSSVEFEKMTDGRWIAFLITRQTEPRGVPLEVLPIVRLHECEEDGGGDAAGDRSSLRPPAPVRSMGVEKEIETAESPAP